MAGVRLDNVAIYQKDMYKAAFQVIDKADKMRDKIYSVVSGVQGAGDKATQMLGLGDLERHTTEGQAINFSSPAQGWAYYVKYWTFSGGLSLTFEAVQDTTKLGNFLKALSATWAEASEHTKEEFAARPFNDGGTLSGNWVFNGSWVNNTDPSGNLMYDSSPMFCLTGNEYTHKGGGTYYNSVAGYSLSPINFQNIYVLHTATNNRSELDRPMKMKVDTLLTLPGADYLMALRILQTTVGLPGGELNDKNIYSGLATPLNWDYLTDTGSFYVGKKQHKDFQFHERQKPLIRFFRDETNAGYKASFMERYGVMLKDRPWCRGGGSSDA